MTLLEVNSNRINQLIDSQLTEWETARRNYRALESVRVKELMLGNCPVKVQFNPARIVSSAAKVDARSLKERPCFLCAGNRPAEQQGIADGNYTWLVNPFPIFPRHLTIPDNRHTRVSPAKPTSSSSSTTVPDAAPRPPTTPISRRATRGSSPSARRYGAVGRSPCSPTARPG